MRPLVALRIAVVDKIGQRIAIAVARAEQAGERDRLSLPAAATFACGAGLRSVRDCGTEGT